MYKYATLSNKTKVLLMKQELL